MSDHLNYFSPEQRTSNILKKNLIKDDDTGKIIVTDYDNNKYESDIFGRKLKFFLPKITGIKSGLERNKINLIKNINYSASPSNNNSIIFEKNENIFHQKNINNYHPYIYRLDGFNCFPRPISLPFYNIPNFQITKNLKRKLNKEATKYYNEESKINKKINNRVILTYLTKDLNENKIGEKNKEKLLGLIDRNIDEMKEEYKIKLNALEQNPTYIALNKFKKKIYLSKKNQDKIKLKEVPNKIKTKYQIIHNINQNTTRNNKKSSIKIEKKYIDKYCNNKGKNTISSIDLEEEQKFRKINIFKKNNKKKNIFIGPDKLNNIFRSKDFGIGRSIKMEFGNFSYEERDKIFSMENKNNNTTINNEDNDNNVGNDDMNKLPNISSHLSNNKSRENLYQDKDTAETMSNNMIRNNTEIRIIDEKIEDDELSLISKENETEDKNKNRKIKNIRTLKFMNNNYQHEKELLEGIKIETPREEIEILPPVNIKKGLKNNGQLYREDLSLLKLTNPKKFESIAKKDENDMKLLIKKLGRLKEAIKQ